MFLGYQNGKIKFYTAEPLPKNQYNLDDVIETDKEYVLDGDEYILKDEIWQEKNTQREKLKMALLTLTAADVERALYKAKGLDFDDILEMVKENGEIDYKALKIEFKANNFYRGNPYINQIGTLLGYTSDDMDILFQTKEFPIKTKEENKKELEKSSLIESDLTEVIEPPME